MSTTYGYLAPECRDGKCSHEAGRCPRHRSRQCLSGECTHWKQGLACSISYPEPTAPAADPVTPAEPDHGGRAYLKVDLDGRPLLGGSLADLALAARVGGGVLLPFTYRDPIDADDPDAPRPLRQGRLVMQDLGLVADREAEAAAMVRAAAAGQYSIAEAAYSIHRGEMPGLTEEAAMQEAREVWPEAEGFERVPGGWTFRVGAGYSSITDSGVAATDPQGTRKDAQRWM
jgi:hypothetical protein